MYLRTWDEYERYTIKLTASDAAGVGRSTSAPTSPDALERRVAAIEATGLGRAGPTASSASARRILFATPTATRWASTTRPSGRYVAADGTSPR